MNIQLWMLSGILLLAVQANPASARNPESDSLSIWVNGACGMCKERIEEAAFSVRGVQTASWDMESRMLSLTAKKEKLKLHKLHYRVASAGHDTRELLAPDPVYEALPACCKYRDPDNPHFRDQTLAVSADASDQDHEAKRQGRVTGRVMERNEQGKTRPLMGANIYWGGSSAGTISGLDGSFSLPLEEGAHLLVVSFVGYPNDTLHLHQAAEVEIEFSGATVLEEVQVVHRVKPTSVNFNSAFNLQHIHEKELTKAACCNLSESFETNPTVDAGFTDAVTGTRKIEMLGLAGPYVQTTRENMPDIRGLSALYGLKYTPGSWIQGIQLNTGAGSVVNGYESVTGQINVELHKPESGDPFFVNLYGNIDGRMEANIRSAYPLGKRWHGSLMLHGNLRPFRMDQNGDGFMDHPAGQQLVAMKRFKYQGDEGFESQLGFKFIHLDQHSGQLDFDPEQPQAGQSFWGSGLLTKRAEIWMKAGKVFENRPYSSLGFQASGLIHRQDAFFGLRDYDADQESLYANLIYQSILGTTDHQYRVGLSFQGDRYSEYLSPLNYERTELVPGTFLEYTYNHLDRFSLVAGIRADFHSIFGPFLTPRLHLRYEPLEKTVFRISGGRGQKTASVFAENIGILASSRTLVIESSEEGLPYGLDAEVGWTAGFSFAQAFRAGFGEAVLKLDYYHTRFQDQVVVDLDQDPREVHFYMLDGPSYSHSIQAQLDLEPLERYDIRLAYRLNDVRTTYGAALLPRPLTAKHRAFLNMAYATRNHWSFDLTWNWQGSKRIPGTESKPEAYQLDSWSPPFSVVNVQVSKQFLERLDLYLGIENFLDYRQEDPILAADDPFGPWFDSSLIWGPVFGRKLYAGLRFWIN